MVIALGQESGRAVGAGGNWWELARTRPGPSVVSNAKRHRVQTTARRPACAALSGVECTASLLTQGTAQTVWSRVVSTKPQAPSPTPHSSLPMNGRSAPCKQDFWSSKRKERYYRYMLQPPRLVCSPWSSCPGEHGRWTWPADKANAFRLPPLKSLASLISTRIIGCTQEPQTQCFVPI